MIGTASPMLHPVVQDAATKKYIHKVHPHMHPDQDYTHKHIDLEDAPEYYYTLPVALRTTVYTSPLVLH